MVERVTAELDGGAVLLVDGAAEIDLWSLRVVRALGDEVRVVETAEAGDDRDAIELGPIARDALGPLFHGPDRLLHLREDAAEQLWLRTGGLAARVAAETDAWVRTGMAFWEDGRLRVTRPALNGLQTGASSAPYALAENAVPMPPLDSPQRELLAWFVLAWPEATLEVVSDAMGEPKWFVEARADQLTELGVLLRLEDGRYSPVAGLDPGLAPVEARADIHGALAGVLPSGAEGRLLHMIASGADEDLMQEALTVARRYNADGRTGQATATLRDVLGAISAKDDSRDAQESLLLEWADMSLGRETESGLRELLHAFERVGCQHGQAGKARALVSAALTSRTRAGADLVAQLETIGELDRPGLERWRWALRVLAARNVSRESERHTVAAARAWAERSSFPPALGHVAGWEGWLRYGEGRFAEAAEAHHRESEQQPDLVLRLRAQTNAASAALEAFDLTRAVALAEAASALAARHRQPDLEGRAEWVRRSALYRMGQGGAPDLELVEAAGAVGLADLEALICMTEGATAWRADQLDDAVALVTRAGAIWDEMGRRQAAFLMECLLAAVTGASPAASDDVVTRAEAADITGYGIQYLGLAAMTTGVDAAYLAAAARLADEVPRGHWSTRLDVISVDEALAAVRGS